MKTSFNYNFTLQPPESLLSDNGKGVDLFTSVWEFFPSFRILSWINNDKDTKCFFLCILLSIGIIDRDAFHFEGNKIDCYAYRCEYNHISIGIVLQNPGGF